MDTKNKIILRDYQYDASKIGIEFFKSNSNKKPIFILPTGAGKSIVISEIASKFDDVLVLQPRKEILEQNYEKYLTYNSNASIFSASKGIKEIGNVTFATIGSVYNSLQLFKHFKHIIIDECHTAPPNNGRHIEVLNSLDAKIIGVTATPYRLHTTSFGNILKFITRTKPRIFDYVAYNIDYSILLDKQYLNPIKYNVVNIIDESRLFVNSMGTDYTETSLKQLYIEIDIVGRIIDVVKRLIKAGRKHILVFTHFVDEARQCSEKMGEYSAYVHGGTSKKEREETVRKFKNGEITVVFNAMVYTLGFDFPQLDTVVFARTTLSLALYYQVVGRLSRIHKDKNDAWFIDLSQTFYRFGRIENLKLGLDKSNKPAIFSREKQLTNVYY